MGLRAVTIFEHQLLPYERLERTAVKPSHRGVPPLDQLIEQIERLNSLTGREILRIERKGLRAGSIVGMLRLGEQSIEILPKIDFPIETEIHPEASAARNLLTMLSYAYDLPVIEQELIDMDTRSGRWFDLLTRLFVTQLHRQVISGLSQGYRATHAALPLLRGRWDVQRQIQHSGQPRHTFDVVFDEYTADIPINQVFRYVLEQIVPLATDSATRQMVEDLRPWFDPVTLLPQMESSLVESIRFNQLNERYRTAFNLARLFLTGETPVLTHGILRASAFLLDMNALFEQFIAAFLERHRKAILPPEWKTARIHTQGKGLNIYLARAEQHAVLRLRPDLLISLPGLGIPPLVADTKYKRLHPSHPNLGTEPADVYQMLAYAVRLKCPLALLIYPQIAGQPPVRRRLVVDSAGISVIIVTVNLHHRLDVPDLLIDEMHEILSFVLSEAR